MNQDKFRNLIGETVKITYEDLDAECCGECGRTLDDGRVEPIFDCPVCGSEGVMSDRTRAPTEGDADHCDRCGFGFELIAEEQAQAENAKQYLAQVTGIVETICTCGGREFVAMIPASGTRVETVLGTGLVDVTKRNDRDVKPVSIPEKVKCKKCGKGHDNPMLHGKDRSR